MQELFVTDSTEGQRLDTLLQRHLPGAGKSFLYKMLRKKNITLNGKKAQGNEKLLQGDLIRIWFSQETLEKFGAPADNGDQSFQPQPGIQHSGINRDSGFRGGSERSKKHSDDYPVTSLDILYEDEHVVLVNKPAGMLTQKAGPKDVSLCEHLIGYLLRKGEVTTESLRYVRPSACNRLDRNTSGIVCCGKTTQGLQQLSALFRERSLEKWYLCPVKGRLDQEAVYGGYLSKDTERNQVSVLPAGIDDDRKEAKGNEAEHGTLRYILTRIRPLRYWEPENVSLLGVELLTGRSHQIRAQLSAMGYPILGDPKYGDEQINRLYREQYHLRSQLLHCAVIGFPVLEGVLSGLSGLRVMAPVPKQMRKCLPALKQEELKDILTQLRPVKEYH